MSDTATEHRAVTDALQAANTADEIERALRLAISPRELSFGAFMSEQAAADSAAQVSAGVDARRLLEQFNRSHPRTIAAAEHVNYAASSAFVAAVARVMKAEAPA